jgi:predicted TIM-barrel fold metal-dependent hydrolase
MSDVLEPPRPHHPAGRVKLPRVGAIDCDVHPAVPGMKALLPYLPPHWREQLLLRGIDGLDLSSYPLRVAANSRPDWRPAAGKAGAGPERLIAEALDAFGSRLAILNPLWGVEPLHNADMAAAIARAVNEWIAREWLDRDSRLRAAMLIPLQDADLAVQEIERAAADRRFVQILCLAMGEAPLGNRRYWRIWEAVARHGLVLGIHAGSSYRHSTTSNGWPSYYLEDTAVQTHAFQAQLLSLVAEGVFTRLPNLRVVLMESGFTWLPQFLWRATRTWRAMRAEVPWVDRAPADIIREHVRVTLQPTDAPPRPADLARVLAQIGSERMLLFSTDYPHWHFDADEALPAGLSDELTRRILVDNPLETYPRLQEDAA